MLFILVISLGSKGLGLSLSNLTISIGIIIDVLALLISTSLILNVDKASRCVI